jgi:PAS domain S-box-containing protein
MPVYELDDDALKKMTKDELVNHISMIQRSRSSNRFHPDISFVNLVEGSSDAFFVVNLESNLIYYNNAWKEVLGNNALLPGQHYSRYIKDLDKERSQEIFIAVTVEGKTFKNEILKIEDGEGRKQYFSASYSPQRNSEKKITGLLASFKNITMLYLAERKLKEKSHILEEKVMEQIRIHQELQVLNDFNTEIIKNAPIGIFMIDTSGIQISENPKLKEIMGHGNQTRIGVNLLNYEGFQKSGLADLFEECIRKKKPIQRSNVSYIPISRDRELVITMSMMPVLNKVGAVEKVVAMVEDNTAEFIIADKVIKVQRNAILGVFSSEIASDIRNNVNRILMDLSFVSNNLPDNSPAIDYITELKENAERLKLISDDLISLSIADESEKMPRDLISIFEHPKFQLIFESLSQFNIKLETQFPDERPQIFAATLQLHNIFKQLILNARDAMPNGGFLKLYVKTLKNNDLSFVVVEVQDTGFGISEENIKKIFKPFYSTKGENATGLGLMIVCFILDDLHGTLGIKSTLGEGTTMRVVIPMLAD